MTEEKKEEKTPSVVELQERIAALEKKLGLDKKPPTKEEAMRARKRS